MMKTFDEDSEDDLKEFSDSDQHEGLDGSEFSSDQESDDDEDADVSDDEAENIHHRLVQAIERFSKSEEPITKRGVKSGASTKFSAESSTFHGTEEVSLDALLNALDSTKGISTVKKTLADLEKLVGIPTHVEKVVSDRMERDLTYSKNKGEMSKWDSIVTSNRHVKSLDLAQDKRQQLSYKSLVTKFKPSNDFEEEVNMVVLKSNVADAEAEGQEIEQLRGKKMSSKEIRQKQAELAKVKALLFYEQIKRHRLNKIKSKAYHRIRKRQKQKRIGSAEPEQGDESDEEEEEQVDQSLERVKERMSLRHKNTGKWARMASSRAHTDKSLKCVLYSRFISVAVFVVNLCFLCVCRQAYHDSVLLGQELSKKMSDDPASDRTHPQDNSDSESVDQEFGEPLSTKTAKSMKKSIDKSEIEGNMSMSSRLGDSKYGKLLDMNFMKRAASIQREKALEDAQTVLRELQDLEAQELSEEEFPASAKSTDDKRLQEAKKAMDKIFSRTTNSVALSSSKKSIVREAAGLSVENTSSWDSEVPNEAEISPVAAAPKSENPWMDSKPQPLNPKLKSLASKKSDSVVHVTALPISKAPSAAVVLLSSEDNKESKSKANGRKPLLMQKSQVSSPRT